MSAQKLATEVIPFKGLRYEPKKAQLEKAVAPPYDVISSQEAKQYRSYPYNICHLILPSGDYQKAAELFQGWQKKQILTQDTSASFYLYSQEYLDQGVRKKRLGCMGLLRLQELEGTNVFPHEYTLEKPREDRLSLLRSVGANLSPVFAIVHDQDQFFLKTLKHYADQHSPQVKMDFQEVQQALWQVTDSTIIQTIREALSDEKILIADGHHRYESALAYRSEQRRLHRPPLPRQGERGRVRGGEDAPYEFVLVYFVSAKDEGLTIWPIHRVLQGGRSSQKEGILREINRYFDIRNVPAYQLLTQLNEQKGKRPSFGLYLKGKKSYLLTLQQNSLTTHLLEQLPSLMRQLDVAVLHTIVLKEILDHPIDEEHIYFTSDADDAIEHVEQEGYEMALLLNPTPIEQVYSIASTGTRLPQKSTYFYPKLLSGLLINKLT